MKSVTLTKLSNDYHKEHPNNINEGYTISGMLFQEPIVGQSCCVNDFCTSSVVENLENGIFKTINSTYKIEILGEITIKEYNIGKKKNKDKITVTDMLNRSFEINVK